MPDGVLWILSSVEAANANLVREAEARGVDGSRLVFAPRADLASHLARFRCADLFLDTFPCTAYTTASDALWAGVPVVTRIGDTFASRVAASILHAAELPHLVTDDTEGYYAVAAALRRSERSCGPSRPISKRCGSPAPCSTAPLTPAIWSGSTSRPSLTLPHRADPDGAHGGSPRQTPYPDHLIITCNRGPAGRLAAGCEGSHKISRGLQGPGAARDRRARGRPV